MSIKTVRKRKMKPTDRTSKSRVSKSKTVRLDMRINQQAKMIIERAASITGQTVTDFAISNLLQTAMETIERYEKLLLSDRGRDQFLAALDRPAKPLPALAKAARLHAKATAGD